MPDHLVLTVIGPDRPGIVERLSGLVAENGGNWLASRMCRLGGEFAGIAEAEVPGDHRGALERALEGLVAEGLRVSVRGSERVQGAIGSTGPGTPAQIALVGLDRPGIVHEIARVLAERGVNVEELTTGCTSAPMSGETLFEARALVRLPADCDVVALRDELEHLAGNLMMDLTFEPGGEVTGGGTR